MRSDRPAQREIVDSVGHNRVGIKVARKRTVETGPVKGGELRQPVMPVTVFFFEPEGAVLETKAAADIETAVVSRASGPKAAEKRTGGGATDGVDPEGDGCRVRNLLVWQTRPPALRADVIGHRIGAPEPSKLRVRRGATKRHSKRCASA